ncbi:hypothetical protein ABZX85_23140 [Streptomyces sp. NPDC004539]|uniref:hypothetical protein n=1 Tax=Streptomyces sp. NPDC004539 TaxID=3154280 RepID=UPI0033BABD3F
MKLPFVSRRQHDTEIAALRQRILEVKGRHEETERERRRLAKALAEAPAKTADNLDADAKLLAEVDDLKTRLARAQADVVTLSGELAAGRESRRPIDGGTSTPRTVDAELRQARNHARALGQRLAEVTTANLRCTCGSAS